MKVLGVSRVAKGFAYRAERLALHGFSGLSYPFVFVRLRAVYLQ